MLRASRLIVASDESVVYHCMGRTALPGFPMEDVEKIRYPFSEKNGPSCRSL